MNQTKSGAPDRRKFNGGHRTVTKKGKIYVADGDRKTIVQVYVKAKHVPELKAYAQAEADRLNAT